MPLFLPRKIPNKMKNTWLLQFSPAWWLSALSFELHILENIVWKSKMNKNIVPKLSKWKTTTFYKVLQLVFDIKNHLIIAETFKKWFPSNLSVKNSLLNKNHFDMFWFVKMNRKSFPTFLSLFPFSFPQSKAQKHSIHWKGLGFFNSNWNLYQIFILMG